MKTQKKKGILLPKKHWYNSKAPLAKSFVSVSSKAEDMVLLAQIRALRVAVMHLLNLSHFNPFPMLSAFPSEL